MEDKVPTLATVEKMKERVNHHRTFININAHPSQKENARELCKFVDGDRIFEQINFGQDDDVIWLDDSISTQVWLAEKNGEELEYESRPSWPFFRSVDGPPASPDNRNWFHPGEIREIFINHPKEPWRRG